ncbi:hypothetical protein [Magnetococcus marinus]|nr:hypothetical protein [Magnetococcus marinus]
MAKKKKRVSLEDTKPADAYLKLALLFYALFFVFIGILKSQGLGSL